MEGLLPIPLCLSERERRAKAWEVVLASRGLIALATWKNWGQTSYYANHLDELQAAAEDGVYHAALVYRPERGKWSTYAMRAIRQKQGVWRWDNHVVHVPAYKRRGEGRVEPKYEGFYESTLTVEPEEIVEPSHEVVKLRDAINRLPYRDAKILHLRYCVPNPATLKTAAQMFGLSVERVRQIEERSIKQLRTLLA